MGQHRLVRGNDVLARRECCLDTVFRGAIRAADQLDKEIGVVTVRERHGIVGPCHARKINAAILVPVSDADAGDLQIAPGPLRDANVLVHQQVKRCGADRAEACDTDFERRHCAASCAEGS